MGSLSWVQGGGSLSGGSLSKGGLCPGGSLSTGVSVPGWVSVQGVDLPAVQLRVGFTYPTGMHSFFINVYKITVNLQSAASENSLFIICVILSQKVCMILTLPS